MPQVAGESGVFCAPGAGREEAGLVRSRPVPSLFSGGFVLDLSRSSCCVPPAAGGPAAPAEAGLCDSRRQLDEGCGDYKSQNAALLLSRRVPVAQCMLGLLGRAGRAPSLAARLRDWARRG